MSASPCGCVALGSNRSHICEACGTDFQYCEAEATHRYRDCAAIRAKQRKEQHASLLSENERLREALRLLKDLTLGAGFSCDSHDTDRMHEVIDAALSPPPDDGCTDGGKS